MKKKVFCTLIGATFLIVGAMSFVPPESTGLSGTLRSYGGGSIIACVGSPTNCVINK